MRGGDTVASMRELIERLETVSEAKMDLTARFKPGAKKGAVGGTDRPRSTSDREASNSAVAGLQSFLGMHSKDLDKHRLPVQKVNTAASDLKGKISDVGWSGMPSSNKRTVTNMLKMVTELEGHTKDAANALDKAFRLTEKMERGFSKFGHASGAE